jgi:predicted aldo/keto reductase-like oxidoreductase
MKYRKMGSLGWDVSVLGFGAMRLPTIDTWNNIDYEKSSEMLRYAIDNGVNYVDTAWSYHTEKSEIFIGKTLTNGYREKVKLVTKSPIWLIQSRKDFHNYFNKQIEKLNTEYLDIYLFHSFNRDKWEKVKKLGLVEEMEALKSNGLIRHIGFSFHGSFDELKEIIDYYPWDVTLLQYNYVDTDYQATTEGINYAHSKNVAVAIMEPLRGGRLTKSNAEIEGILNSAPEKRTLVDWALQFVWNHPGVCTVLSGMGNLQEVNDNIGYADKSSINSLSDKELGTIDRLKKVYKSRIKVPCTNCNYCMPCPHGVNISENFYLMNNVSWAGKVENWVQHWYDEMGDTSNCIQCGECLDKCPQNIDIPTELEDVRQVFEEGKSPPNCQL